MKPESALDRLMRRLLPKFRKPSKAPMGCPMIDPVVQPERLARMKKQCPPKQYRGAAVK